MKVSLNWLKDYVDIHVEPKEYADKMTMSGTKVETIEYRGHDIKNVVIGKITEILPHPDAERLIITKVDIGKEESIQIVTGASNLRVGDIIPVAVEGAVLPGGVKIKKGKLRGVESFGMLCSSEELGIDYKFVEERSKNGIYILGEQFTVGEDAVEAMGLNDVIVEFELTANRPDCRSLIGIAKETAATLGTDFRLPSEKTENASDEKMSASVEIKDFDLCPRFVLREIKNVKVAPSPFWLQQRLISYGIRPINNIVDITNYVMIEYGQPMHAYDFNKMRSHNIVVRRAHDKEKMMTLDGKEYELDGETLVIADEKNAIGIAGIMGGFDSQIDEHTTHILLEAASFDADSVRLSSRRIGLRTDASSNFEKGIDILRPVAASKRACHLIEQLGAGEVVADIVDVHKEEFKNTVIFSSYSEIRRMLGEDIPDHEIKRILEKLLFEVKENGDAFELIVPAERMDMSIREDIAEEVARIYGYDNIASKPIYASMTQAKKSFARHFEDRVKLLARENGLTEIATYSFISPKFIERSRIQGEKYHKLLRLLNPLGEETSVMRTTLVPQMLETAKTNLSYKNKEFYAFECGNTFFDTGEKLPVEERSFVAGMYGEQEDFYTAKGRLEGILNGLGVSGAAYVKQTGNTMYHNGRCADVYYRDTHIATVGEIHPLVLEDFGIKKRVYVFELFIAPLGSVSSDRIIYDPIPRFPAIEKDIALVVDQGKAVGELEKIIRQNGKKILEQVEMFDIFEGEQLGVNKKSVAFALVFRAKDRTLTDEEVNEVLDKILQKLKEEANAVLR